MFTALPYVFTSDAPTPRFIITFRNENRHTLHSTLVFVVGVDINYFHYYKITKLMAFPCSPNKIPDLRTESANIVPRSTVTPYFEGSNYVVLKQGVAAFFEKVMPSLCPIMGSTISIQVSKSHILKSCTDALMIII